MSVNNPDKLDTLFKKLEEDIENGKFLEYLKEIDKKEKERKEYVNHKEFFEWLAKFVDKLHKMRRTYSTEDFLYMDKDKFTEKDIYNEDYIGDCIFDLFDEIGKQQEKEAIEDDSWSFSDTEWYFKFNNKMYFICRLIGQGTEYIV